MSEARTLYKDKLTAAIAEYRSIAQDTPHRRDLDRFIKRAKKQLRIYDKYHRG